MTFSNAFGNSPNRARHILTFDEAAIPPASRLRDIDLLSTNANAPTYRPRAHIWELSSTFHCSIVGTCLSTAEVRAVLSKLGVTSASALSEHQVHGRGVQIAGRRDFSGKLLHKALDRKHKTFIDKYSKTSEAAELLALWAQARKDGEIPGAYWALMTHPASNDELLRSVFEDVHMLSHLVGAANRADIRRLNALQQENQDLMEKVARQQKQLKELAAQNEQLISEVQGLMVDAAMNSPRPNRHDDAPGGQTFAPIFEERLSKSMRRAERLEQRVSALEAKLSEERRIGHLAAKERDEVQRELATLEGRFGTDATGADDHRDIEGLTVLYVGGRTHHIAAIREATTGLAAKFLHHDGGEENNSRMLSSLLSRADVVVFPVDCVSHQAVGILKKACRQAGKPYRALRSSGLGSYLDTLRTWRRDLKAQATLAEPAEA